MYGTGATVNNTVYLEVVKREDLRSICYTQKNCSYVW